MEEKGGSAYRSESSSGRPSIASIFNSIQQKLKGTSTLESSTNIFTANTAQISKPCDDVSDISSSVSEPVDNASVSSVFGLSSHNSHSGNITVTSEARNNNTASKTSGLELNSGGITFAQAAPQPCCDSVVISTESSSGEVVSAEHEADDITDDDSANSQQELAHCSAGEDSAVSSERSDRVTSGLIQTDSAAGIAVQAMAENATRQSEVSLQEPVTVSQGVQHQNDNIVIKQEKDDTGYEHCYGVGAVAADVDREADQTQIKEPFLPGIKMEEGGKSSDGNAGFWRVGWDLEDSDADDESDSDSSSLSSFGLVAEDELPEKARKAVRTRGEILPEELPPLENLYISLPEETWLEELGVVTSIVGVLVVIESTVDLEVYSPLNDDTVLFYENREPFGVVFEVFGQCKAPSYCVRFNSADDITEKGIEIGLKVFFVPNPDPEVGNITHYVFVQKLKQMKGSDASWKENNEPPECHLEYSDDEEEMRSKAKRKAVRSEGRRLTDGSEEEEVREKRMGPGEKRPAFSAHGEAPSWRRPEGDDYSGPAKYPRTSFRKFFHPSSHFRPRRHEFRFRRDFPLSEPVFRPSNPVRDSPHSSSSWGPLPPPSPTGPWMFGSRPGPENAWVRGPFMGGSGQGLFRDVQVRPPFPDRPQSADVSDTPNACITSFPVDRPSVMSIRSPLSDSPSSGSFGGGPSSNPGSRSFSGGPVCYPDSGSFGGRPLSNPSHGSFSSGPLCNPDSGSFGGRPLSNPSHGFFSGGPLSNPSHGSFSGGPLSNPSHGSFSSGPLSNPGCQSFSNDPVRAPFSESRSKDSFGSAPNSNPFPDVFGKPPHSDSIFTMDISQPPPNVFIFSAGQTSSPPSLPPPPLPPPPPQWTLSPSPASSLGLGGTPGFQSASAGSSQPFSFNFTHGRFDPPPVQQSLGAASPTPLVRFQGGPLFAQYHKGQN